MTDQEIQGLKTSAQTFAITHSLLASGLFPGANASEVASSLRFIENLHSQIMKQLEPVFAAEEAAANKEPEQASVVAE